MMKQIHTSLGTDLLGRSIFSKCKSEVIDSFFLAFFKNLFPIEVLKISKRSHRKKKGGFDFSLVMNVLSLQSFPFLVVAGRCALWYTYPSSCPVFLSL